MTARTTPSPSGGRWPEGPVEGPLGDSRHEHASGRIDAVDCARGLALIGMGVYHLSWDFADFRLASPMLPFTPQMRLLSHIVGSAFLVLVGVSLALAHRNGLNVRAFWRRLAIVAGAAALVTAGSFVFAPSEPITFGILHCIAVASLLAGPFVTAPAWASLVIGLAAIAAPFFIRSTLSIRPGSYGLASARRCRIRSIGARFCHGRALSFLASAPRGCPAS